MKPQAVTKQEYTMFFTDKIRNEMIDEIVSRLGGSFPGQSGKIETEAVAEPSVKCPRCGSNDICERGTNPHNIKTYFCKGCERGFQDSYIRGMRVKKHQRNHESKDALSIVIEARGRSLLKYNGNTLLQSQDKKTVTRAKKAVERYIEVIKNEIIRL